MIQILYIYSFLKSSNKYIIDFECNNQIDMIEFDIKTHNIKILNLLYNIYIISSWVYSDEHRNDSISTYTFWIKDV